jgi:hypothetical protein
MNWKKEASRQRKRGSVRWIGLMALVCFPVYESCNCDCNHSEPEPEPQPQPQYGNGGGGCGDFGCGLGYPDGGDYWDTPYSDFREEVDWLTDERELDPADGEGIIDECNGIDDDGNGIVDDVAGTPRCGDDCCNGGESKETCPEDCICGTPSVPQLLSPRSGEKVRSQTPSFKWLPSSGNCGEAFYDLVVDDSCGMMDFYDCLFPDPEVNQADIHSTVYTPETDLPLNDALPRLKRYFWKVRSCYYPHVCSQWSRVRIVDIGRAESDLNGDGFSDLAIGVTEAYGSDPDRGKVFVFYVKEDGIKEEPSVVLNNLLDDPGAGFGVAVSTSGDLNGDGFCDLVVGAENQDGETEDEGAFFVYYGSSAGIPPDPSIVLNNPDHKKWSRFGSSLDSSGDLNGDGFSDLVVGAKLMSGLESNEGFTYIYFGSESGVPEIPGAVLVNPEHCGGGQFGLGLSSGGDLNGDGLSDLVIGAPFQDGDVDDEGKVYVYYGFTEGISEEPSLVLENPSASAGRFGTAVSSDGDFDSDGYADLVVGADRQEGAAAGEGAVMVYRGSISGLVTSEPVYMENPENDKAGSFGSSVRFIGDVNEDGFDDVAAGAPGLSGEMGRLFIFSAGEGELDPSPGITIIGLVQWFGYDIAGVGDANHDGISDFAVTGYMESGLKVAFGYHGADYCCTLVLR